MRGANQAPIAGIGYIVSDARATMSAFDALPKELRDICNYAPVSITPVNMVGHPARIVGPACRSMVAQQFPNWRPLKGEDW